MNTSTTPVDSWENELRHHIDNLSLTLSSTSLEQPDYAQAVIHMVERAIDPTLQAHEAHNTWAQGLNTILTARLHDKDGTEKETICQEILQDLSTYPKLELPSLKKLFAQANTDAIFGGVAIKDAEELYALINAPSEAPNIAKTPDTAINTSGADITEPTTKGAHGVNEPTKDLWQPSDLPGL